MQEEFERSSSVPSSPDAEVAALGSIIMDNRLMPQALEMLVAEDFYVSSHRVIFNAMINLFGKGSKIDPVVIVEEIKKSGHASPGVVFVTNLSYGLPHITSITHYAKIIRGKAVLRGLIKEAARITEDALAQEDDPSIILERANKGIFTITLENTEKTFTKLDALARNSLQKTWDIQQSGKSLTGVTTGFADLDALTLGWQKSDLILVAGRPGMGKSSFALSLSQNAAIRAGKNVAFFSLEMPEEQIAMRILCSEARIDSTRYQAGYINNHEEWPRLAAAEENFATARLWVEDTAGISVLQLKAKAMRLAAEHGALDLIVVDYIGLMSGASSTTKRYESRQQEVTQISKDLKGVARELKVPLIAVSQLNRGPENRTDHRPQLSDLRESGALEQDADIVAFVYRPDEYRPREEPKDNIAEIIVAKHRNGRTDTIRLRFDEPSTCFNNLTT